MALIETILVRLVRSLFDSNSSQVAIRGRSTSAFHKERPPSRFAAQSDFIEGRVWCHGFKGLLPLCPEDLQYTYSGAVRKSCGPETIQCWQVSGRSVSVPRRTHWSRLRAMNAASALHGCGSNGGSCDSQLSSRSLQGFCPSILEDGLLLCRPKDSKLLERYRKAAVPKLASLNKSVSVDALGLFGLQSRCGE